MPDTSKRDETQPPPQDMAKRAAALAALDHLRDGMRLGLGTGSTAAIFVALLGKRVAAGLRITAVPTSERTAAQARSLGIALSSLDDMPELDLTVDGADEFDRALRLIKGGGGALLREKIVACASRRMLVIADTGKERDRLGHFPLPVEVNRFGLAATRIAVERAAAGCGCTGEIALRLAGDTSFVTDGGHLILDGRFGMIPDPEALAARLAAVPGVVEHGLFLGIADTVIVGAADGTATTLGHDAVR